MLQVFEDCADERYVRISSETDNHSAPVQISVQRGGLKSKFQRILFTTFLSSSIDGKIIESEGDIIVENVPIITPNGDRIVDDLTLKVKSIFNEIRFDRFGYK